MSVRPSPSIRDFFARIFVPERRAPARTCQRKGVIKGTAGNVIIVKSPDTEYFKEAIFILRDDVFSCPGTSRKQILRDARKAAGDYASAHLPPQRSVYASAACFLLGAACSAAVFWIISVI